MKQHATATKIVLALVITVIVIGFSAFGQKEEGRGTDSFRNDQKQREQDTTARRKHNGHTDARHLEKMEEGMKKMDEEMKRMDVELKKIDFSKMEKDINAAIQKVDFKKAGKEMEAAIEKVDFEKVGREIETAMKKVDWEKMNSDLQKSMARLKEVEMPKIKLEMEKAKAAMEKEGKNIKIDGEKMRADIEKSMQEAKISIEKAKAEIKSVQEFTKALETDGLINKKRSYKIEVKDGELYIDDKKQPQGVSDKYKQYFKKENFKIVHEADDRI